MVHQTTQAYYTINEERWQEETCVFLEKILCTCCLKQV